ncbi:hypothetical protein MJG53_015805 [Ovis ammon polii x Ovis aries]|uniref:Uncharacterized protein n=1 Tax=Ovis ammon polii x Ovis aries TaxID=2918886 RepID=A0ACB9UCE7_9CETA|nr:hypothetical protein MJG53_015805 [Ovis ammon polii x Ovis aries]
MELPFVPPFICSLAYPLIHSFSYCGDIKKMSIHDHCLELSSPEMWEEEGRMEQVEVQLQEGRLLSRELNAVQSYHPRMQVPGTVQNRAFLEEAPRCVQRSDVVEGGQVKTTLENCESINRSQRAPRGPQRSNPRPPAIIDVGNPSLTPDPLTGMLVTPKRSCWKPEGVSRKLGAELGKMWQKASQRLHLTHRSVRCSLIAAARSNSCTSLDEWGGHHDRTAESYSSHKTDCITQLFSIEPVYILHTSSFSQPGFQILEGDRVLGFF